MADLLIETRRRWVEIARDLGSDDPRVREVVEEVEAHRLTAEMLNHEDRLISNVAAEREHRFLGLVKPDPSANRIVRRAWEVSERLGGKLDLLWVAPAQPDDDPEINRKVDDLRRLAAVFGARLIVERDIARAVIEVAGHCGTTHIVMGIRHLRKRLGIPQRSLVDKIPTVPPPRWRAKYPRRHKKEADDG